MTLLPDTGPLVAAIDRSDHQRTRCAALLESADGPPLIPATVIVEACWPTSAWALVEPTECQVSVQPPPEAEARVALIPPGVKVPVPPSGSK